jgi:D-alanyl-D-alanine dipeptidase
LRALSSPSGFVVPAHRTDGARLEKTLRDHFAVLRPHLFEVVRECPRPADLTPIRRGESPYLRPSAYHGGPHLVRKAVHDRLIVAAELAHVLGGCQIAVGVARRTLAQQVQLWNWRLVERFAALLKFRKKDPPSRLAQLARPTGEVANPMKHGCASPHITGGAVDVLLLGPTGRVLVGFDRRFFYGSEQQYRKKFLDPNSDTARHARLLEEAMHAAGFVRYCREGWHFETITTQLYRSWRSAGKRGRCYGGGHGTWDPRTESQLAQVEESLGEAADFE